MTGSRATTRREIRILPLGAASTLAATLVAAAAPAQEQGEGEKRAAAQALFDEARTLTAGGKYPEACPKLRESLRLDPSIGTKFYLADCLEHVGKLASAWTYYQEVADVAKVGGQKDRERYAQARADALKPRLPRVVIKLPEGVRAALAGLSIRHDGVVVGEAQWGISIPVDAGAHTVDVTAKGRSPAKLSVEAKEGEVVEVVVPLLAPVPPPDLPAKAEEKPPPLPPPPSPARRIAGFVVGGAGVVVVSVGAFFGARALNKKSDSNADGHCDAANTCDATGLALRDEAFSAANASTASFVVGAVAIAGGIVLVATAPKASPAPTVTVGPAATSLSWRW